MNDPYRDIKPMPDREIIHSTADVPAALAYAFDAGFQVMLDEPQIEPKPRLLAQSEVSSMARGVFYLFRATWVYGPIETMKIDAGCNQAKFFVKPRVNFSPITLYFGGERKANGQRQLGAGLVSFDRNWLELPRSVVRPTPTDVEVWHKKIFCHLTTGVFVRVGKGVRP